MKESSWEAVLVLHSFKKVVSYPILQFTGSEETSLQWFSWSGVLFWHYKGCYAWLVWSTPVNTPWVIWNKIQSESFGSSSDVLVEEAGGPWVQLREMLSSQGGVRTRWARLDACSLPPTWVVLPGFCTAQIGKPLGAAWAWHPFAVCCPPSAEAPGAVTAVGSWK